MRVFVSTRLGDRFGERLVERSGVKIGERLGKRSLRLGERLLDSLGESLVETLDDWKYASRINHEWLILFFKQIKICYIYASICRSFRVLTKALFSC